MGTFFVINLLSILRYASNRYKRNILFKFKNTKLQIKFQIQIDYVWFWNNTYSFSFFDFQLICYPIREENSIK